MEDVEITEKIGLYFDFVRLTKFGQDFLSAVGIKSEEYVYENEDFDFFDFENSDVVQLDD